MLARRYSGRADNPRVFAHQASDDIMTLTQYRGVARTRIAFASDRDSTAREAVEGALHRRLRRLQPAPGDGERLAQHPALLVARRALARLRVVPPGHPPRLPGPHLRGQERRQPDRRARGLPGLRPRLQPRRGAGSPSPRTGRGTWTSGWRTPTAASPRRLTQTRASDTAPCWSPTGQEIAFTSNRTGTPQLWVMDAEGLNVRRLTTVGNYNDGCAWSPARAVQRDRLHLAPRGRRLRHRRHRPGHPAGATDHPGARLLRVPVVGAERAPPRVLLRAAPHLDDHHRRPGGP